MWKGMPSLTCFDEPTAGIALVTALAVDHAGSIYAGGTCGLKDATSAGIVAKWNGERWILLGELRLEAARPGANVMAMVFDDENNLYVGGRFVTAGGVPASGITRWDGERWWPLGEGLHSPYRDSGMPVALLVSESTLYVAGDFERAGNSSAHFVAEWDGERWQQVGDGFNEPAWR